MSDYVHLPPLTEEQVEALTALHREFKAKPVSSIRRRMGANTNRNMSIYSVSKWLSWTAEQRARFRAQYPEAFHRKALVSYFIQFPGGKGFLDRQTTWEGQRQAGTIVAYALHSDQHIWINDTKVMLNVGQGIAFNLREVHEVKRSTKKALWANVMVLQEPSELLN